jgi:methionine synthase II (cobalamin-independent)
MDHRTMVRELEEVIARSESATARETKVLNALPDCFLRRRKQSEVRAMQAHLQRLRKAVRAKRRPGALLN